MESLILVAYATRYGSTEETARMVGAILGAEGLAVEVRNVNAIPQWKPYSAVVLAAALYMGKVHKHARSFLRDYRQQLAQIPVALLVPGPVGPDDKQMIVARQQLAKELARLPWLHPFAQQIVGGKWDPSKLSFPFSWTLRKIPASDARDWAQIRAWAREIAGKLQPAAVAQLSR